MAKREEEKAVSGFRKLKQDLKQHSLQRGYVLYGEEAYLRETYFEQIKKELLKGPAADLNYHRFHKENIAWEQVVDAVEAFPMMAERTLVQIEDINFYKASEADMKYICGILEDIPEHCCLVFTYGDGFERDKRKKKLDTLVEENLCLVEFPKQSVTDLSAWVRRHVKAEGKEITDANCQLLCFRTGNSMTTMASEIPKLCAYASGAEIQKQDIETLVEPVLDAVVYDITNAIALREFDTAMLRLHQVLRMQEEPIAILGAIGSNLRRTYCAKVLLQRGKGSEGLMQLTGLRSEYAAKKTMEAARRVSVEFCQKALLASMRTDYALKNSVDDPQRLLELFLIQLAQEAQCD